MKESDLLYHCLGDCFKPYSNLSKRYTQSSLPIISKPLGCLMQISPSNSPWRNVVFTLMLLLVLHGDKSKQGSKFIVVKIAIRIVESYDTTIQIGPNHQDRQWNRNQVGSLVGSLESDRIGQDRWQEWVGLARIVGRIGRIVGRIVQNY